MYIALEADKWPDDEARKNSAPEPGTSQHTTPGSFITPLSDREWGP